MIIKQFDLKKNIIREINFFLLYGKNIGLIEDTIKNSLKPILPKNIFNYEENDILKNIPSFRENLVNKSFFESEKLIIINRVTDRLFNLIKELTDQNIRDISIILVSDGLEKKSKIRNFFEKSKQTICIPFYEDNIQTLSLVAQKFLRERKIDVSQQDLNTLAERAKGDRINLRNELEKIESFSLNKKKNWN